MVEPIVDALGKLSIPSNKIEEVLKKPQIVQNIEEIRKLSPNFTKMHYSLACTAPKKLKFDKICELIDNGKIKHENMLRGVYSHLEGANTESVEDFIDKNDFSRSDIEKSITEKLPMKKGDLLREMKKEMPFADFKIVMEIVGQLCNDTDIKDVANKKPEVDERYRWLEEGEIKLLKLPKDNRQRSDEILAEHLARTGGRVITRFPPEPNGQLHIGHAKAINISFMYAEKFGGETLLRFDDTNPRNEKEEHYQAILEDLEWLGFKPARITASSDYNDRMLEMAEELIKKGKAYICHCSLDEMRHRRQVYQNERDKGNEDATILSPYRNRPVEENLAEFAKMKKGLYEDGAAVLRFKMDLESKNPQMLDLVGCRCIDIEHPGKKRNWHVYPNYEFALCVSDSLEDVTHSFCSREFMSRQESYHWLLRNLGLYEPVQWEFSRLNLSNTVLSKRKMSAMVRAMGMEWDDPRFYTIAGMRRRGFPPAAINKFVRGVGITYSETIVDVRQLENCVRTELLQTSSKLFCVRQPIKVTIRGLGKMKAEIGKDSDGNPYYLEMNKIVYIDGSDFSESPAEDFYRLTKSQPVGLIGIGAIRYVDGTGNTITCELCEETPLKYIQWVPNLETKVTLRIYKPLFKSFSPGAAGDFMEDVNADSLEIIEGFCDPRAAHANPLDRFQFIRIGFFCCDKTSSVAGPVFNLTLPLKNIY